MSSCLFCQYGIALLDVPIGKPGDPVGLCKNCSSMTCGWHGARTPPAGVHLHRVRHRQPARVGWLGRFQGEGRAGQAAAAPRSRRRAGR